MNYMEATALRKSRRENQKDFWARVKVTQSGGSRYESGHHQMPEQVEILLAMVYSKGADARALLSEMRKGV